MSRLGYMISPNLYRLAMDCLTLGPYSALSVQELRLPRAMQGSDSFYLGFAG
jgi:hypothetical protein